MTHILEPGKYTVANNRLGLHLGRGIHEEGSLLPKQIVTLPDGVQAPIWKVERLRNGRYKLAVSKHPDLPVEWHYVAEINKKVYAILDPEDLVKPTEWIIKHAEGINPNVYIVEAPSRNVWTISDEEPYTQVTIERELIPQSTIQHFTFYKVRGDRDD